MAAYDSYRPDHQAYDSTYDPRTYQGFTYHQQAQYPDQPGPRSRASSNAPSDGISQPYQQPLNNALSNAFDKSDSARTVDPDLIAQITAEVKRSVLDEIKMTGVGAAAVPPQPSTAPPQHYVPHSPTSTSASFPSRNVHTPPSPHHQEFGSQGSASPDLPQHESSFDGAGDAQGSRYERALPSDKPAEGPRRQRPAPVSRMSTETDFSPIEKKWQRLFDAQGQPTARLGQFLRGLALHLIDDYEPKKSLVISPAKMLRFYEDVKLNDEVYPWQTIFGKVPCTTLTKIYRELRCQHHLIQESLADQPYIPALTPEGFQDWMTAMIQAYPSLEYERLSQAVLHMPISNADDSKERFPKELPRRLFPLQENLQAQQRCAAILSAEGLGPRRAPTFPPPPPMAQSSGSVPSLERERSPYAGQPNNLDERVFESDDEGVEPLSKPIERERKPYSAVPGGGKQYEDRASGSTQSDSSGPEHRKRAQSTASQGQWVPPANAQPSQHHPRTGSGTTGRRPRSPSFSNYGHRSDPSVRDPPAGYYAGTFPYDVDAELKRNDWARRQAEEEGGGSRSRRMAGMSDSSYDQQRSVYDDEYYRSRGNSNGYDNRYDSRRY